MTMLNPYHPGKTLRDDLAAAGFTVTDAAARLGCTRQALKRGCRMWVAAHTQRISTGSAPFAGDVLHVPAQCFGTRGMLGVTWGGEGMFAKLH